MIQLEDGSMDNEGRMVQYSQQTKTSQTKKDNEMGAQLETKPRRYRLAEEKRKTTGGH